MSISRITLERAGDLQGVMAACFQEGASDYWSAADMVEILSLEHCYGYCARKSAKKPGEYSGFIVVRVIGEEAQILSLGVLPARRRTGTGRALVGAAMADPRADQASKWFLEVRAENKAAIGLYESLGFAVVGKRPDYYRDARSVRSDALTMRAPCATGSEDARQFAK